MLRENLRDAGWQPILEYITKTERDLAEQLIILKLNNLYLMPDGSPWPTVLIQPTAQAAARDGSWKHKIHTVLVLLNSDAACANGN